MRPQNETPAPRGSTGASRNVHAGRLNEREDNPTTESLQAERVRRDFGLQPLLARTIAAHAFSNGGMVAG